MCPKIFFNVKYVSTAGAIYKFKMTPIYLYHSFLKFVLDNGYCKTNQFFLSQIWVEDKSQYENRNSKKNSYITIIINSCRLKLLPLIKKKVCV